MACKLHASVPTATNPREHTLPATIARIRPLFNYSIPHSHHLIVTTKRGVYSWGSAEVRQLFQSTSEGIVAAKKTSDGKNLLAVADSQIVVLQDLKKGNRIQSYSLKGTDGYIRFLQFAHGSDRLFFTTTLQNAVQSYSVSQDQLLTPEYTHPSPPTVSVLSPSSRLLLTVSAKPPTISLTDFSIPGRLPLLLYPTYSSSTVVAAAFHPDRQSTFALAFADATLGLFDAGPVLKKEISNNWIREKAKSRIAELGHVKKLHALTTQVVMSGDAAGGTLYGSDPENGISSIGHQGVSIVSVAFMPGSSSTTVSVGADGKCCIVDCVSGGSVARFHIGGSATSLSVTSSSTDRSRSQFNSHGRDREPQSSTTGTIIAIGRQDGVVLLYDAQGVLLAQQMFGPNARILDVEWMRNKATAQQSHSTSSSDSSRVIPKSNPKESSPGKKTPKIPVPKTPYISSQLPMCSTMTAEGSTDLSLSSSLGSVDGSASVTAMKASRSSAGPTRIPQVGSIHLPEKILLEKRRKSGVEASDSATTTNSTDGTTTTKQGMVPQVPPRPKQRKEGKLAMRQAQTRRLSAVTRNDVKVVNITYKHIGTDGAADAPAHPRIQSSSGSLQRSSPINIPSPLPNVLPNAAAQPVDMSSKHDVERPGSHDRQSPALPALQTYPPRPVTPTTPNHGQHGPLMHSLIPLSASRPIFCSPLSTTTTEASNDTIVNWRPASAKRIIVNRKLSERITAFEDLPQLSLSATSSIADSPFDASPPIDKGRSASHDVVIEWPGPLLPRSSRMFNLHESGPVLATKGPPQASSSIIAHPPSTLVKSDTAPSNLGGSILPTAQPPSRWPPIIPSRTRSLLSQPSHENSPDGHLANHQNGHGHSRSPVSASFLAEIGTIRRTLTDEMAALRAETVRQFDAQKLWLQMTVRDRDRWALVLESENRRLRLELKRMGGGGPGPEAGAGLLLGLEGERVDDSRLRIDEVIKGLEWAKGKGKGKGKKAVVGRTSRDGDGDGGRKGVVANGRGKRGSVSTFSDMMGGDYESLAERMAVNGIRPELGL